MWEEKGGKEKKDDVAAEEAAQCLQQQREGEGNGNGSETGETYSSADTFLRRTWTPLTRQYL